MKKKKIGAQGKLLMSGIMFLASIALLMGSTYAWFTDSASTAVNKIQAGNLDIEMWYADPGDTQWQAVTSSTMLFNSTGWEPGYTQVVYLQVRNAGSLAMNHALAMNIVGESAVPNVAGEKIRLAPYLQVDIKEVDNELSKLSATRAGLGIDTSALVPEKTMKAFNRDCGLLTPGAIKTYQLAIYMPQAVGNEANYRGSIAPAITFGIKVTGSQAAYESDSFGNTYDSAAPGFISVSNAKEFENAFAGAAPDTDLYVLLENDIDLGSGFARIIREKISGLIGVGIGDVIIDGNGHSIFTSYAQSSGVVSIELTDASRTVTIKNATIRSNATAETEAGTCNVAAFEVKNGTINLIGCTILAEDTLKSIGVRINRSENLTLNLTDCTIEAAAPIKVQGSKDCTLNINGCTLKSNYSGSTESKPAYIDTTGSTNITCYENGNEYK